MAFPQTPLAVIVEMLIGGVWTDVTQWVFTRKPITIERGRKEEGKQVEPGRCRMILNNEDGRWSSRKPDGPYYGLIGRNTQVRVSVDVGASYLATTGVVGGSTGASTPDAAALDITGDIDVRFDATLDNWMEEGSVELAGKGATTGNQRSWLLLMRGRRLHWRWSTTGADEFERDCTVDLPLLPSGRLAVRVTHDVNDGSGSNVVTFWTAETIAGPWTQLGDPVTGSVTSIFNSSAALRVGDGWSDLSFFATSGAVHAFELRSGIGGTLVASPDFTTQTPGAASFVDGSGLTWTIGASTSISNRKTRFTGEVSSWPVRWDVSGEDVEVEIEASGILRRIGQGNAPLASALLRHISAAGPIECWPLTDGAQTTRGASLLGGSPMFPDIDVGTGTFQWSEGKLADWIEPTALIPPETDGTILGYVPDDAAAATKWSVDLFRSGKGTDEDLTIGDRGAASDADPRIGWYLSFVAATNEVELYVSSVSESSSSSTLQTTITNAGIFNSAPHHIRLTVDPGGSTSAWEVFLDGVSRATGTYGAVSKAVRSIRPGWFNNALTDNTASLGYITYWGPDAPSAADTYAALLGHQGEAAAVRAERLCDEAGITFRPSGVPADTTPLGAQRLHTVLEVLQNAAAADIGAVYEDREDIALRFRDRNGLYNQTVRLALDYAADEEVAPPLEPVDDDQLVRNHVTVTREGGITAPPAVLESGPLSVQAPPNGVGIYDEALTLSLYTDDQPLQHAAWLMHLGTWDEARYPVVHVDLSAAPHLIDAAAAVDIGDRLTISNPPAWLPPDTIDLLAQGYTEVLGHPNDWDIYFNCTPAGPWTVGVLGDPVLGRADTAGTELAEPLTTTETGVDVLTTVYPLWVTDPAQFPFDLKVGGEVITATACTSSVLDTFTRSVTDGWGTPNVGAAWTNSGGAATDFDVTGTAGTHTMTTVNVSRRSDIPQVVADFDLIVDVASNDLASGGSQFVGLMARVADSNNLYTARVEFTTTAAVVLTIRKRVGGVETELGTFTTGLTHVAGTFYRLRFQGVGSTLRARIWAVTAVEQESVWHVQVTDTALTATGGLGVRSILAAANTDVNPIMSYDNFASLNPQTFTVARSVNGVVKAHSAGAAVRLAHPMRAAL